MAAVFNEQLQCIECKECGEQTPVHRATLRDAAKFTEIMGMARELHEECFGTAYEAGLSRRWKELMIRSRSQGIGASGRVVYRS